MRKIVASLFTTVDGVVEAPEKWHFPFFNEEMGAVVGSLMRDTQLLGRKSYETFAATWPAREAAGGDDAPLAAQIGDQRKIVVSNQQLEFTWRNSEQLRGDLIEAVTALKAEPGGDIAISGSISIVRQLLDAGLIDELHLLVDPIAVRDGMRLFDGQRRRCRSRWSARPRSATASCTSSTARSRPHPTAPTATPPGRWPTPASEHASTAIVSVATVNGAFEAPTLEPNGWPCSMPTANGPR